MSISLDPAWLLHRRPYGDNGFLLDFLTLSAGRVGVVVRGARRKQRGGSLTGVLQPFSPLLVEVSGRGDLKTLRKVEAAGARIPLVGKRVFSGLYLNELLSKCLPRYEPLPELFSAYGDLLSRLEQSDDIDALRRFEFLLLETMGYGVSFAADAFGEHILASERYRFDPNQGFLRRHFEQGDANDGGAMQSFKGASLISLQRWLEGGTVDAEEFRLLREVTRLAFSHQLSGRSLRSRELLRQFLGGQVNSSERVASPLDES